MIPSSITAVLPWVTRELQSNVSLLERRDFYTDVGIK